jgi:hypothetical protein
MAQTQEQTQIIIHDYICRSYDHEVAKLDFSASFCLFAYICTWRQRNYRFYYMFVFSATLLCLYIHGFCWVYIKRIQNSEEISIWKAMIKTPASIALIIYSFFCIWFVGGLTVFHTYLISTNQVCTLNTIQFIIP